MMTNEIKISGKLAGLIVAGKITIDAEIEKARKVTSGFYYSPFLSEKSGLGNAEVTDDVNGGVFIELRNDNPVIIVDTGECYPAEYNPVEFLEYLVAANL